VLVEVNSETDFVARNEDFVPENIRPKIVEGQLRKWYEEIVLLNQKHVNEDKYGGKTIKQLQDEVAAKTGENVSIRRFARFHVGQ
jgi:elongation factor Ts